MRYRKTREQNGEMVHTREELEKMAHLVPHLESYYRHGEGNSDAHLKASLMGPFAIAFQAYKRPALGVYLDACKAYPHLKDALQR